MQCTLIALPPKQRNNTQTFRSESMQSTLGTANGGATGTGEATGATDLYVINYPIEEHQCQACKSKIKALNLAIRSHMTDLHGISTFKYSCTICNKLYGSINSARAHHNSCKKKNSSGNDMLPQNISTRTTRNNTLRTTTPPRPESESGSESACDEPDAADLDKKSNKDQTDSDDNNCADPNNNRTHPDSKTARNSPVATGSSLELRCEECRKEGVTFVVTDRIKLVTHMRHKHPYAYELSKTTAQKRIAWSNDEDRILAELEIKLRKSSRNRILNRLAIEWKKLAKSTGTTSRTQSALGTRRRNPQYKKLLAQVVKEQGVNYNSESSTEDSELSSDEQDTQTRGPKLSSNDATSGISYEQDIREFIKMKFLDQHIRMPLDIQQLAKAFVNNNTRVDVVESAYEIIQQSISEHHDKERSKRRPARTRKTNSRIYDQIRSEKRKRKAEEYKKYQKMYDHDKAKLVSVLLDGIDVDTQPPPINIASAHYTNIWSKKITDDEPITPKHHVDPDQLTEHITYQEIELAINNTNAKTACGPDSVNMADLKRISQNELTLSFNIWLAMRRVPRALKMNRTVLIPKGNKDLDDIGNWRPITIASTIIRLYNKILGARLTKVFQTSDKQMGFKPVNGCAYNIMWLNCLLKHARRKRRNLYVCLLDVSKAFDSVPHQSIERALRRNNAPQMIIDIINDQYSGTFTSISYHDRSSTKVEILRGVKQGDPLSSLLFNMVIDELFDLIGNEYGYAITGDLKTNARCFADDLVLTSGSKIGMGKLISTTTAFLKARGLNINPKKCVSIGLAKGYKGKKSKIEMESAFYIDDIPIPMLGYVNNSTRYLGVSFTSLGAAESKQIWNYVKEVLEKVERVKIKPQHKVDLLRSYIIPRFIYSLTHTEIYPKMLLQLDRYIRQTVRKILHLPVSLSNEFFYLPIKDGGLQLSNLHDLVGISKIKIYKSIKLSTDDVLKHLIECQGSLLHERFLHAMQLGGIQPSHDIIKRKEEIMKERRLNYAGKIHGVGFEVFSTSPQTNKWLDGTFRGMNAKDYIRGIKLRTNSLETKVTCTRGLFVPKTCGLCGKGDESLMHILQFCEGTRGTRYTRHHQIRFKVAETLRNKGYAVFEEKTYHPNDNSTTHTRPDIVAIKDKKAWILDVTCVYEISGASFIRAAEHKKTRYQPIETTVKAKHNCTEVETLGLTVGSRGSMYYGHLSIWKKFGFTNLELFYLAINCLQSSIRICSVFRKSCQVQRRAASS